MYNKTNIISPKLLKKSRTFNIIYKYIVKVKYFINTKKIKPLRQGGKISAA
ncbi:Uncharacterized protein dnl_63900 [Desulfonema limicola]|uniref:Uncharacterized protein n=1 Tax=Desulfonema limicola TaxID=45656 RepID=A0A975BF21_9BACT|nr:Uncharacterized protein dnl_63900 [Desulfonema limicola]